MKLVQEIHKVYQFAILKLLNSYKSYSHNDKNLLVSNILVTIQYDAIITEYFLFSGVCKLSPLLPVIYQAPNDLQSSAASSPP